MKQVFIQKSKVDPQFFEIVQEDTVIDEIKIPFYVRKLPKSFSSKEEVISWLQKKEKELAKSYALFLLNRQNYSKVKLMQKLLQKGYSESVSSLIAQEMIRLGFLCDEDFAEKMILEKVRAGYGPFYIEQYLKKQGLSYEKVHLLVTDEMQKQSIIKWVEKMKQKDRMKIIAFLLRRGFEDRWIRCILA